MDHRGEDIPSELQNFFQSHIFQQLLSKWPPEVLAQGVEKALDIADGPESTLSETD